MSDGNDREKLIIFWLSIVGLPVTIIGVLLHLAFPRGSLAEAIDLAVTFVGGVLVGGLPVQKLLQAKSRRDARKTRESIQRLFASAVRRDPSNRKGEGGLPKLFAMDIEGCITPAGRSAIDLDRLWRLRAYCDFAAQNRNYPSIVFYTGRSQGYVELLAQSLGMVPKAWHGGDPGLPSVIESGTALYYPASKRTELLGTREEQQRHRALIHKISEYLRSHLPATEFEPKCYMVTINPAQGAGGDATNELLQEALEVLGKMEPIDGKRATDLVKVTASASAVDITPVHMTKLTGLRQAVKKVLQQDHLRGVVALGDHTNDLEVLEAEGVVPYCPKHAHPAVIAVVPDSNHIDKDDVDFAVEVIERECGLKIG